MKKTTLLFSVAIWAIVASSLSSCRDERPRPDNGLQIAEVLNNVKLGKITLPDGTTTRRVPGTTNAVEFIFPKGIEYVGFSKGSDKLSRFNAGCYECTGICTKGCDVIKLDGEVGCSRCENGSMCMGKDCNGMNSMDRAGFIDYNQGIKFITRETYSYQKFLETPDFEVMNQLPEVRAALEKFQKEFWSTKVPTRSNSKSVAVNFFGAKAVLLMPVELISDTNAGQMYYIVDDVKCSCQVGTSGCTLENIREEIPSIGVTVIIGQKCISGSCVKCRMTWNESK